MGNNHFKKRFSQIQQLLNNSDFDALALNPGPDLIYLTGLNFHLMERPVIALFKAQGEPLMVLPELETEKLNDLPYSFQSFSYTEDRSTWAKSFQEAFREGSLINKKIGIIPRRLRVLELRYLESASPESEFVSAQHLLTQIRMVKEDREIQALSEAVHIAQCALQTTLSALTPGVTEKEIASTLVRWLLQHGSDPELPFFPLVSFGPNSAKPHATPSDRPLKNGDLILIDWGANVNGYFSDITRTFVFGDPNPELEKISEFVLQANSAGRSAVKPGVQASAVDRAAREIIQKAGYGNHFPHRTGHGLGREAHEEPYLVEGEDTLLEPGMIFTVEPGIYLPGRGGVRIEDDILVTPEGYQSLTNLPRELIRLDQEDPFAVSRC